MPPGAEPEISDTLPVGVMISNLSSAPSSIESFGAAPLSWALPVTRIVPSVWIRIEKGLGRASAAIVKAPI